jgi:hypothetical protein
VGSSLSAASTEQSPSCKLIVTQLLKKLEGLCGTRHFIASCWILGVSQLYGPSWPVEGVVLLLCVSFIVCTVSFTVYVALCAAFCLSVVCYFV